jgi:hypothetical protein
MPLKRLSFSVAMPKAIRMDNYDIDVAIWVEGFSEYIILDKKKLFPFMRPFHPIELHPFHISEKSDINLLLAKQKQPVKVIRTCSTKNLLVQLVDMIQLQFLILMDIVSFLFPNGNMRIHNWLVPKKRRE